ncbi:MAG: phosphorylase [bacterium]|nr:phosphorylase [bacterium]
MGTLSAMSAPHLDLDRCITQTVATALESGSLQPLNTRIETVHDCGVDFLVHVLSHLKDKSFTTSKQRAEGINPFLPPDPDLFVSRVTPTHLCVLNKFNVIDRHLLIITDGFQPQDDFLTLADFEALAACMEEIDGLGFYNAGLIAGASQPHKHLQLVPTPLGKGPKPTPIDDALGVLSPGTNQCPELEFEHRLSLLNHESISRDSAALLLSTYERLLAELDITSTTQPYNMLLTHRWMMLVPRKEEEFEGTSINALGFAGSLLVRDMDQLKKVRQNRPMHILQAVAGHQGGSS